MAQKHDPWIFRTDVEGAESGNTYRVALHEDGHWGCTCWPMKRRQVAECAHIREGQQRWAAMHAGAFAPPARAETYDPLTVDGIEFQHGVNDAHLYYEAARPDGTLWLVMRPHVRHGEMTYWGAQRVEGPDGTHVLNFAHGRTDGGPDDVDPLYYETDRPEVDPPLRLLRGLVRLIHEKEKD